MLQIYKKLFFLYQSCCCLEIYGIIPIPEISHREGRYRVRPRLSLPQNETVFPLFARSNPPRPGGGRGRSPSRTAAMEASVPQGPKVPPRVFSAAKKGGRSAVPPSPNTNAGPSSHGSLSSRTRSVSADTGKNTVSTQAGTSTRALTTRVSAGIMSPLSGDIHPTGGALPPRRSCMSPWESLPQNIPSAERPHRPGQQRKSLRTPLSHVTRTSG